MAHNIVYHSRREFNHAGINLKDHGNQAMWSELRRAFLEHQVIAILGQDLSPDDQMNVGRFFGEPCFYPFAKGMETMLNGVIGVNSAGLKHKRGGDRSAHHARIRHMAVQKADEAEQYESRHPVVRTHPETGAKCAG